MSVTVFDLDDLCDDFDPFDELVALKDRIPGLKVTLFAIPSRCSDELLARYRALDWVELGVHGYHHALQECAVWGYDEANEKLEELEGLGWEKLFKAPNWAMNEDVYSALCDRDWIVADHAANAWCSGMLPIKRYTYNLPGLKYASIHGHTWDCRDNGPSDWSSMFEGVDGGFLFVSEAAEERNWGYEIEMVQVSANNRNVERLHGTIADRWINWVVEEKGAESVCDFGGNDGIAALHSRYTDRVTVIDIDPNSVERGQRHGLNILCARIDRLPLDDGIFDWGVCSHTLEHVEDFMGAMNEMRRVCRKGVLVVVPIETKEQFDDTPEHVNWMTPDQWREALDLEDVGMVEGKEYVGMWVR